MTLKTIIFFLFTALLLGCSTKQNSPNVTDEERFVNFYADYLTLQEENRNLNLDSLTLHKRIDSLYQVHHLQREQVAATMSEYNKDATRWKEFYEKVVKRLETMQSPTQHAQK